MLQICLENVYLPRIEKKMKYCIFLEVLTRLADSIPLLLRIRKKEIKRFVQTGG